MGAEQGAIATLFFFSRREGFPAAIQGEETVSTQQRSAPSNPPGPVRAVRRRTGPSLQGIAEYLRGVREELRKAVWPTRAELIRLTQVVLAVIAVVAIYCGALDAVLSFITSRWLGYGR
jgi:preprotein translocase subunit SecE